MPPRDTLTKEERAKRRERLSRIGIREIDTSAPKLKLKGKEVRITRKEHGKHYYDVEVKSLEHLKALVGNPDRALETNEKGKHLPHPMDAAELPDGPFDDHTKLSPAQQRAIFKAAKNVVYGHSRALGLTDKQHSALWEWIREHIPVVPVFEYPDLDVPDGTTVVFSDAAVLNFNVVTVHGSGSIKLEKSAKVNVEEMRVVP